jgi:type I restriction enzyme, S subunit
MNNTALEFWSAKLPSLNLSDGGDLPSEWPLVSLGDLCSFANGVNANKDAYGKGIPFANVLEIITHSHLHSSEIPGRVLVSKLAQESFAVRRGDILFNRTSETQEEVGLAAVYDDSEPIVFGGFVIRGRFNVDAFDKTYVGYALRAPVVRSQIISQGQGAIRANIGQSNLKRILIPVPPKFEQQDIGQALSDVDELLRALDALIAKKRAVKQATMQQLLTGKARLSGFSGDWETISLGELFEFKNGLNKSKSFFGHGTPIVNYMDVFRYSTLKPSMLEGRVQLTRQEIHNFDIRKGDVFFTRTSETTDEIGTAAVMIEDAPDTVFSGFVLRGRPKRSRIFNIFKAYCFASKSVRDQIVATASYTTRALTNGKLLSQVFLSLPQEAEQIAISQTLSDIDAEIAALEARRDKTRAIKQGMMQQLLNGRIRLVKPQPAEEKD